MKKINSIINTFLVLSIADMMTNTKGYAVPVTSDAATRDKTTAPVINNQTHTIKSNETLSIQGTDNLPSKEIIFKSGIEPAVLDLSQVEGDGSNLKGILISGDESLESDLQRSEKNVLRVGFNRNFKEIELKKTHLGEIFIIESIDEGYEIQTAKQGEYQAGTIVFTLRKVKGDCVFKNSTLSNLFWKKSSEFTHLPYGTCFPSKESLPKSIKDLLAIPSINVLGAILKQTPITSEGKEAKPSASTNTADTIAKNKEPVLIEISPDNHTINMDIILPNNDLKIQGHDSVVINGKITTPQISTNRSEIKTITFGKDAYISGFERTENFIFTGHNVVRDRLNIIGKLEAVKDAQVTFKGNEYTILEDATVTGNFHFSGSKINLKSNNISGTFTSNGDSATTIDVSDLSDFSTLKLIKAKDAMPFEIIMAGKIREVTGVKKDGTIGKVIGENPIGNLNELVFNSDSISGIDYVLSKNCSSNSNSLDDPEPIVKISLQELLADNELNQRGVIFDNTTANTYLSNWETSKSFKLNNSNDSINFNITSKDGITISTLSENGIVHILGDNSKMSGKLIFDKTVKEIYLGENSLPTNFQFADGVKIHFQKKQTFTESLSFKNVNLIIDDNGGLSLDKSKLTFSEKSTISGPIALCNGATLDISKLDEQSEAMLSSKITSQGTKNVIAIGSHTNLAGLFLNSLASDQDFITINWEAQKYGITIDEKTKEIRKIASSSDIPASLKKPTGVIIGGDQKAFVWGENLSKIVSSEDVSSKILLQLKNFNKSGIKFNASTAALFLKNCGQNAVFLVDENTNVINFDFISESGYSITFDIKKYHKVLGTTGVPATTSLTFTGNASKFKGNVYFSPFFENIIFGTNSNFPHHQILKTDSAFDQKTKFHFAGSNVVRPTTGQGLVASNSIEVSKNGRLCVNGNMTI